MTGVKCFSDKTGLELNLDLSEGVFEDIQCSRVIFSSLSSATELDDWNLWSRIQFH